MNKNEPAFPNGWMKHRHRWVSEYPHRVVRYVPDEGLDALHQELDWMLNDGVTTGTAMVDLAILTRWRNALAQVIAPPQEDREP